MNFVDKLLHYLGIIPKSQFCNNVELKLLEGVPVNYSLHIESKVSFWQKLELGLFRILPTIIINNQKQNGSLRLNFRWHFVPLLVFRTKNRHEWKHDCTHSFFAHLEWNRFTIVNSLYWDAEEMLRTRSNIKLCTWSAEKSQRKQENKFAYLENSWSICFCHSTENVHGISKIRWVVLICVSLDSFNEVFDMARTKRCSFFEIQISRIDFWRHIYVNIVQGCFPYSDELCSQ